jgi:hypothetical protein
MSVLCPLCGKEHIGIERVQEALLVMLEQVHAWEQAQQVPVLLKPRFTVVLDSRGQRIGVVKEG